MQENKTVEHNALSSERAFGIDALKLLSMFMVVMLHLVGEGGLMTSCAENSVQLSATWLLTTLSYCAVDIFAIVTGYLMVNKTVKYKRAFDLWFQVVFYTVVMAILMYLIYPQSVDIEFAVRSLFPISFNFYWYVSAYVGLFFFIPFINKMLNALSKKEMKALVIIIVVLLSVVSTATLQDPFSVDNGYGTFWLAAMYVVGAYLKKYPPFEQLKPRWFFVGYLLGAVITWGSRPLIKWLSLLLLGREFGAGILLNYISPTVVFMSIMLFLGFSRMKMPSRLGKILAFASPLSLAVYIIHYHPLFLRTFIRGRLVKYADGNVFLMVGMTLLLGCAVFLGCLVIEFCRVKLFQLCKVKHVSSFLGTKIDNLIGIYNKKTGE